MNSPSIGFGRNPRQRCCATLSWQVASYWKRCRSLSTTYHCNILPLRNIVWINYHIRRDFCQIHLWKSHGEYNGVWWKKWSQSTEPILSTKLSIFSSTVKIVRLYKSSWSRHQRSFQSHAEVGDGSCLAILLITTGNNRTFGTCSPFNTSIC